MFFVVVFFRGRIFSSVFIYYFQDVAQEAVRAETVTKRTFTANSIFGGCKIQGCQELVVITNKIKVAAFCSSKVAMKMFSPFALPFYILFLIYVPFIIFMCCGLFYWPNQPFIAQNAPRSCIFIDQAPLQHMFRTNETVPPSLYHFFSFHRYDKYL